MKRRTHRKPARRAGGPSDEAGPPSTRKPRFIAWAVVAFAAATLAAVGIRSWPAASGRSSSAHPPGTLTFNKDIAPIIFENCAPCHRPGQAGPFSLLSYQEVRKRAKSIGDVTGRGYMPPWLPEPGYGQFAGERRLSAEQTGMIAQWVAEGAVEGRATDLPPLPRWPEGWTLGQPDLIVPLPSAYALAAEGKDVYRNFVVPIPTTERRYVRAVEFHPGNNKVVHHAFIETDATRQARHLVDQASPPGFDGMQLPDSVQMPTGQMLGWQPGKPPYVSPEGLSWALEPRSDVILQLHLHPSGKPESVLPAVGFYFTDRPPTNSPFRINLLRFLIDIPAGAKDYAIENRYVLPVDVDVIRVNPHTHYLGKELQGYALLPDGTRKWLLWIKNWDFNWQGDYRYAEPVHLPKGTTLVMHFTYDNSADNIHNPSQPPRRVRFGLQTTDEMGELWFQVLARNAADRELLGRDFFLKFTRDAAEENEALLRSDPADAAAHTRLGVALLVLGRPAEAVNHLRAAVQLRPDDDEAHSSLGGIFIRQNRLEEARAEFETVARLKPGDYQAQGALGSIFLMQGKFAEARHYYETALRINPDDPIARANLDRVRQAEAAKNRGP